MRTVLWTAALAATFLLAGCNKPGVTVDGDKTVTVTGADGKSSTVTTKDDGSVTVKSETGEVKIGADASDADITLPIYPGAKKDTTGGGLNMETPEGKITMVKYLTDDDFEKVVAFYEKALADRKPKSYATTVDGEKSSVFSMEAGKETSGVTILRAKDKKQTTIDLMINISKK